jgi:hypothetical protein
MTLPRSDTVINDMQYQMIKPSVRLSMPICTKTAVLLGGVLGGLSSLTDAGADGLNKFSGAIASVDPIKLDALFMEAISAGHLHAQSKPISDQIAFEQHFTDRRGDVYQVCVWCLWEIVKDFFPQLGAFAQKAKKAAAESLSRTDGQ